MHSSAFISITKSASNYEESHSRLNTFTSNTTLMIIHVHVQDIVNYK